ncbi:MAG: co-chaperone GroES [Patescibacteria group bacterium]
MVNKSKKLNVNPLFDNVLIRPLEAEIKTDSGIFLPDSAKEKPQVGEVMAIGPELKTKDGLRHLKSDGKYTPVAVKVGDKVMYKKWGGSEVKIEGKEWTIVGQDDILAIVS